MSDIHLTLKMDVPEDWLKRAAEDGAAERTTSLNLLRDLAAGVATEAFEPLLDAYKERPSIVVTDATPQDAPSGTPEGAYEECLACQ